MCSFAVNAIKFWDDIADVDITRTCAKDKIRKKGVLVCKKKKKKYVKDVFDRVKWTQLTTPLRQRKQRYEGVNNA